MDSALEGTVAPPSSGTSSQCLSGHLTASFAGVELSLDLVFCKQGFVDVFTIIRNTNIILTHNNDQGCVSSLE